MIKCPNCNAELELIMKKVKTPNSPLVIKRVVLDAGHGALNPITGDRSEAMTRVYKFPHNGKIVYEGEINRLYTKAIKAKLLDKDIEVIETAPDYHDTSLRKRVQISNQFDTASSYFLSIHCNGSVGHNATGAEGYTSKGNNNSDKVMEHILQNMSKVTKLRSDKKDGDLDKEYNYYVIYNTMLRAGLLELGFYDDWDEYRKLTDPTFINAMSDAIVQGIVDYNNSL